MQNPDFWHDKWQSGRIGFHQESYHPALSAYWPQLGLTTQKPAFVPLCGKSKDMLYLRSQGHDVVGIELSPVAIDNFGKENDLTFETIVGKRFTRNIGSGFEFLVGDFFDTNKAELMHIGAVYDRAALIALPKSMRVDYTQHLQRILPKGTIILLIALAYDQSKIAGPPFSVTQDEVSELYGDWCTINLLEHIPPEDFRGIKATETVYCITVK